MKNILQFHLGYHFVCFLFGSQCLYPRNVPEILLTQVQYQSPCTTFPSLVFPYSFVIKGYYYVKFKEK